MAEFFSRSDPLLSMEDRCDANASVELDFTPTGVVPGLRLDP